MHIIDQHLKTEGNTFQIHFIYVNLEYYMFCINTQFMHTVIPHITKPPYNNKSLQRSPS